MTCPACGSEHIKRFEHNYLITTTCKECQAVTVENLKARKAKPS